VVSADKCNACHGRFINRHGHGANRTEPEVCVICHNGNNPLAGTSADFKRMIHMLHAEQGENYPVWPNALVATKQFTPNPPGIYSGLRKCDVCHVDGSYKQNRSILGTSIDSTPTNKTDSSDNLVISPKASACSSCHSSDSAKEHMMREGGAAFGSVTQAAVAAGTGVLERCDGCHQDGTLAPVEAKHRGD
jgi:OmcA/MtrC family decaheme c-type cytochrome